MMRSRIMFLAYCAAGGTLLWLGREKVSFMFSVTAVFVAIKFGFRSLLVFLASSFIIAMLLLASIANAQDSLYIDMSGWYSGRVSSPAGYKISEPWFSLILSGIDWETEDGHKIEMWFQGGGRGHGPNPYEPDGWARIDSMVKAGDWSEVAIVTPHEDTNEPPLFMRIVGGWHLNHGHEPLYWSCCPDTTYPVRYPTPSGCVIELSHWEGIWHWRWQVRENRSSRRDKNNDGVADEWEVVGYIHGDDKSGWYHPRWHDSYNH